MTKTTPSQSPEVNCVAEELASLQRALSQSNEAVFFTDGAGLIVRVNPGFEALTGYTAGEAVGKDLSAIIVGGPQADAYQKIWRHILERSAFQGTVNLLNPLGQECELHLTVSALRDTHGRITSLVATGRAPDTAKPAMDEISLNPRRRSSTAFHDLRNVLMVIAAHIELLREEVSGAGAAVRHLTDARTACARAMDLVCRMNETPPHVEQRAPAASAGVDKPRPMSGTTSSQSTHPRGAVLLLVEDECIIRESASEFLEKAGFEVLAAGTGAEALECLKADSPLDVLITDLVLPDMSGWQLAALISERSPETKLIYTSGHSRREDLPDEGKNRINFLSKPFSLSILEEKIRDVIGSSRASAACAG